ncbi:uncharacterized protein JN550_011062 [Neoarthrinium moseri]|uniref:uncharacterized protein n=1 Tax=Neoarthrinium moseri TaxID=1658444 RepID=UPI001FDB045C|nr:uncharacterized protein JN550_011062 [Neoarthrinium moseri]KAI1861240.1 hypothetical protein JN550_011062 [Neoarthrinium moseri]
MSSSNNPTQQAQQTQQETTPSFKEQLDHKARVARDPNYGKEEPQPTLLEKVTEYVPQVGNILGTGAQKKEDEGRKVPESIPGPPHRPDHDLQVEEFLKEQHRSKKGENGQIVDH